MLENLSIVSVIFYIGDTDAIGCNEMISLHDVASLFHYDFYHFLVVLDANQKLFNVTIKDVVSLPEAFDSVLWKLFVSALKEWGGFENRG
jgi:hypothetical protein